MTTASRLNELNHAENPARELLVRLGYAFVSREVLAPEREDERGVLLTGRLQAALMRLNEWMTEDQAQRVIFNLRHTDATGMARNRRIHEYLVYGLPLTVDRGGRQETPTIRFFDFDHTEPGVCLNEYVVTTQFRVRRGNERGSDRTTEDDERVVKPDAAIFRRLLDRYGLEAADCVFIDDSPKNITGAQSVGMHAILFREGETEPVAPALRRLGFAV